ncbi:MAG: ribonuclease HI [Deltaproteobacteria bacterium]|nr:ribonuclease HI [Deltaproteobacteria bacterium]
MMKNIILSKLEELSQTIMDQTEIPEGVLKEIEDQIDQISDQILRPAQIEEAPKPLASNNQDVIEIWSDGACFGNPGPGGWACVIKTGEETFEYSGFLDKTTNNIMEMTAALEGIKKTAPGSKLNLTSDSQYLIKGMTSWIHQWKKKNWKKADGSDVLNQAVWKELDKESRERKIKWIWTKGHADDPLNERCDQLAKEAIQDNR